MTEIIAGHAIGVIIAFSFAIPYQALMVFVSNLMPCFHHLIQKRSFLLKIVDNTLCLVLSPLAIIFQNQMPDKDIPILTQMGFDVQEVNIMSIKAFVMKWP